MMTEFLVSLPLIAAVVALLVTGNRDLVGIPLMMMAFCAGYFWRVGQEERRNKGKPNA